MVLVLAQEKREEAPVIVLESGLILGEGVLSIVNLVLASFGVPHWVDWGRWFFYAQIASVDFCQFVMASDHTKSRIDEPKTVVLL